MTDSYVECAAALCRGARDGRDPSGGNSHAIYMLTQFDNKLEKLATFHKLDQSLRHQVRHVTGSSRPTIIGW